MATSAHDYRTAFTRLFGFVEPHPTFDQAHAASEQPNAFARGMTDFWRYKTCVGGALVADADLEHFQHDSLFHFCTARDLGCDQSALRHARARDAALCERLLAIGDSPVGYRPGAIPAGRHTVFHSRHVSQLTLLLHNLRARGDAKTMNFVEIGGGFGNFPRLLGTHQGFGSWTICDLPFMNRLQQWCLARTLPQCAQTTDDYGPLAHGTLRFVDTERRNEFVDEVADFDVLVSTHAWSELSRDDWLWYHRNLLPKARFLLYAASAETPSVDEGNWRLQRLHKTMRLVDHFQTHDNSCIVSCWERR